VRGVWGWCDDCFVKMVERWCGVEERGRSPFGPCLSQIRYVPMFCVWSRDFHVLGGPCDVSLCDVVLFSCLIVVFYVVLFGLFEDFMLYATQ
jgi:hypothetical protein